MGILTYKHLPLVSATKFNVSNSAAIAGSASAGTYGTATNAGNGDWISGTDLPKCRKLLIVVNTAAIANSPAALKVSLLGGASDANGTSGAEIASTVTEFASPAGDTAYTCEIDAAAFSDTTKYYSLALTVKSTSGATDTVIADAVALQIDPTYV